MRKAWFLRVVFFLILLLLACIDLPRFFEKGLRFHAFDVGQGDAFLFRFPDGSNVLVDAGGVRAGPLVVAKLRQLGIQHVDILVASTPREDHIGGMIDVMKAMEVKEVWDSGFFHRSGVRRTMLAIIKEKGIRLIRPKASYLRKIGDIELEVLAPYRKNFDEAGGSTLVLRIVYGEISFLMPGDIDLPEREAIPPLPASTVLKIPRHGSRRGIDEALLRQVRPEISILSYGRGNSYGYPHREVLSILQAFNVRHYATENGDIVIKTDGKSYQVEQRGN